MASSTRTPELSRAVVGLVIAYGGVAVVLFSAGRRDYPNLHTILDTGAALLSAVLAWFFWNMGARIGRPLPQSMAISFAVTFAIELAHALVTVEWSGPLAQVAAAANVLRPSTWPPPAHILPVGLGVALLTMRRGANRLVMLMTGLMAMSVILLAVFYFLPRYTAPVWLAITRPTLLFPPLLWGGVGVLAWRFRASDRILPTLTLMAGVFLVANVAMLYSRAPHDTAAMMAHLGKVSGSLILLVAMMHMASSDMLERMRAEQALSGLNRELEQRVAERTAELDSSEERTRLILETALDAVVTIDQRGIVTGWNAQAERIFGWLREEAIGHTLAEMIIPESNRQAHMNGIQRYCETGEAVVLNRRIEVAAVDRTGREFPVELAITPIRTAGQLSFSGFVRDITERKQAESKLQDQLERLSLLDQTTRAIGERQDLSSIFQVVTQRLEDRLPVDFCCIFLYDEMARMLTVSSVGAKSHALAVQFGVTENARVAVDENGLSRCVRGQVVYEPDLDRVTAPLSQRLTAGGLRSLVAAPLLVESNVFGILMAARTSSHAFVSGECEFLRQLSEHVALAAHQARLHSAVQHAYDELQQTQQAAMQQERLRALGQMASGVAHDINNALSPVALYTESLLDLEPNLSARAREYLTIIQRATEDVAQTVARMQEFYRQREPLLALASVNVNILVQQVMALTRARWSDMPQQRGTVIQVETDLARDVPLVMGVDSEIREALINLVFNAVDAMPDGGTLTLRTAIQEATPGQPGVVIEVSDTGVGMDDETRHRCLEPFFTTKGERGTGLGLAMVYGVVQRHGAEIAIDSTIGRGTTVRMSFAGAAVRVAQQTASERPPVRASRLRILVIDDDPLLIRSLTATLEADGHLVTAAAGGRAGIEAFEAAPADAPFAAVVTDLGMPYVDGRQVAAAIKRLSPSTPVVLLTGWGQRLAAEGDVPPHVDRVLNKPPKLQELRLALVELTAPPSDT